MAIALSGLAATPANAADGPELEVTAEFGKPAFRTDDFDVPITFTVKNVGTRAINLSVQEDGGPTAVLLHPSAWGALMAGGVTLQPGEAFVRAMTGSMARIFVDAITLSGDIVDDQHATLLHFSFSVPMLQVFGHVTGTIFADRNFNGVLDAGEGVPGFPMTLRYREGPDQFYTTTTGSGGQFQFPEVLVARYVIGGMTIDGRQFPQREIQVDESTNNEGLTIRGVSPLTQTLHATMAFTKDTYDPGEQAHLTVTLSNTGPARLDAIVAECLTAANSLPVTESGWGDLIGRGVAIDAGQTRTFDVLGTVPAAAKDFGYMKADCTFGYRDLDVENHARASAPIARVPGGSATVIGSVHHYAHPPIPLPGVQVFLVSPDPCPLIRQATTGNDGLFQFDNIPPGPGYTVVYIAPANENVVTPNPQIFDVVVNAPPLSAITRYGEVTPPPAPTIPSTCTPPTPQARSSGGLANTGVNLSIPTVLGALALLLGAGAVAIARRRRTRGYR